jgi:hypothetical protein
MPTHASAEPALTPVPDLLGRVSAELRDMAAGVDRLHTLAGALAGAGDGNAARDHAYLQALQSADLIEQTLRGLAGFLADLAQAAAPGWHIDAHNALAAITLSDLAARLAAPPQPAPAQQELNGDCEFF